jgi:hypothetical protein
MRLNTCLLNIVLILNTTLVLNSCSTIGRGGTGTFYIFTDPPGAQAATSNGHSCTTPCSIEPKRKTPFVVSVTKSGYQNTTTIVRVKLSDGGSLGIVGNLLLGGPVGLAIDASTGAGNEFSPEFINIKLLPLEAEENKSDQENAISNTRVKTSTVSENKRTCQDLGFKPETDKFVDCMLRLMDR